MSDAKKAGAVWKMNSYAGTRDGHAQALASGRAAELALRRHWHDLTLLEFGPHSALVTGPSGAVAHTLTSTVDDPLQQPNVSWASPAVRNLRHQQRFHRDRLRTLATPSNRVKEAAVTLAKAAKGEQRSAKRRKRPAPSKGARRKRAPRRRRAR